MLLEFEVEAALHLAVQPSCLDSRVARQGPAWLVRGNHFSAILTNHNLSSKDMELISRTQKSNLVESSQFSVAMRALWREFSIAISLEGEALWSAGCRGGFRERALQLMPGILWSNLYIMQDNAGENAESARSALQAIFRLIARISMFRDKTYHNFNVPHQKRVVSYC